jgi:hypothetical protein
VGTVTQPKILSGWGAENGKKVEKRENTKIAKTAILDPPNLQIDVGKPPKHEKMAIFPESAKFAKTAILGGGPFQCRKIGQFGGGANLEK